MRLLAIDQHRVGLQQHRQTSLLALLGSLTAESVHLLAKTKQLLEPRQQKMSIRLLSLPATEQNLSKLMQQTRLRMLAPHAQIVNKAVSL